MNVGHEYNLVARAAMGAQPLNLALSADKVFDGNISQKYGSDPCAITDWDRNTNTAVWLKMWLRWRFNKAYMEI